MDTSPIHPRRLQVGVWLAIFLLVMGFANILWHFLPFDWPDWMFSVFIGSGIVVFVASLSGAICSLPLIFRLRGFPRTIAVLSAFVSLYAFIHCVGFLRAAILMK